MSRLTYSARNARVSLMFYLLMLVLNFFSRRVFIDELGDQLVGLSTAVTSYVGMLNLADMGIATAIASALYAPLLRGSKDEIRDIISLFGFLFRIVGLVIAGAGIVFMLFIPRIFASEVAGGLDLGYAYAAFGTMLTTTLLSYMVNYRQNLLIADQKNYVVATITNTLLILKVLLQMAALKWFSGGYLSWLALELVSGFALCAWLGVRLRREYPWLHTSIRLGRGMVKRYRGIFRNVKLVFSQRIATYVLQQADPIIVSNILSLASATYYTNYTMIVGRVALAITGTMAGNAASIGNLVAEGDAGKTRHVYWQLNVFYFWLAGIAAFGFWVFITPFIPLWLTSYEIFGWDILALLVFNLFIAILRQNTQAFLNAYGLFGDWWASWTEAGINLTISIWAGIEFGIIGVAAGTAISCGLSTLIWKPYFLYRRGFQRSSGEYWLTALKFATIITGSALVVWEGAGLGMLGPNYITCGAELIPAWLPAMDTWHGIIVNVLVLMPVYVLLSGGLLYLCSPSMRSLVKVWRDMLRKRLGRS